MKNIKGFAMGLALGLGIAISSVGLAQETKTADPNQKAESCCSMSCCKDGSCSMKDHAKKDHAKKEHAANMDHSKTHAGHEGCCCCCSGDSCSMEMKDKKAN